MLYDVFAVLVRVAFGIGCGIFVFFIFGKINNFLSSIPNSWDELDSQFSTERMALNGEMVVLLHKIGAPLNNGKFSPEQTEMWLQFKAMNEDYEEMFAKHTDIIINRRK